jgi:hypothetical protein
MHAMGFIGPIWLLLVLIPVICSIVLLIVWACMRGTVGANRFGPDPLEGSNEPRTGQPRMDGSLLVRTFLIFFLGGLLLSTAATSLLMIGDLVWLHCVNDNPTRTCGDALFFSVASPIYLIIIGMGLSSLSLFVAAVLAVLARAYVKQVPPWFLIVILPACVLTFVAQATVLDFAAQGTSWDPHENVRPLSSRFAGFQVLSLLICWWWDRRVDE